MRHPGFRTLCQGRRSPTEAILEPNDSHIRAVSVSEAAQRLGISKSSCKTLIRQGAIRSLKIGARRVLTLQSIADFLAAREAER